MTGIYLIQSPTEKIYIGQAIDIEKRWETYKKYECKGQIHLYNSFKKYGVENHSFHIAYECEEKDLNKEERFYQDVFDVTGKNGLNCKLTKTDDRSGSLSDETKRKISKSHKGKIVSEVTKLKMSEANKGKILSDVTREKMSKTRKGKTNGNKGRIFSEEHKQKISKSHQGKIGHKQTIESKQKMSESLKGRKAWNKGKKHTPETKQKMKESRILFLENKKNK